MLIRGYAGTRAAINRCYAIKKWTDCAYYRCENPHHGFNKVDYHSCG